MRISRSSCAGTFRSFAALPRELEPRHGALRVLALGSIAVSRPELVLGAAEGLERLADSSDHDLRSNVRMVLSLLKRH